ncbi:hypothetical protein AMTR_s00040p00095090 [Amborella trichopoda]|uniref:SAUR family protein n=2 Tax=Amborella trichopoda TaxID=13333 RepID=W1PXM7_AMBTC|nr:hypothetical protein AMTR_s00040p00095090 [Amborella trichopoda]
MESLKKIAKRVQSLGRRKTRYECLFDASGDTPVTTPPGCVAVYVGEERRRYVVPMNFLSHPLFRMLLEKAQDEFGFDQKEGLVVPCSVFSFEQVVCAIESSHGQFDLQEFVEEFAS